MLPSSVRIFVCTEPQDMRRSFDGLALQTRQLLGEDPQSGALFIFVGKSKTRAKVLWFERNGYCLLYKRLHRALFVVPKLPTAGAPSVRMYLSARAYADVGGKLPQNLLRAEGVRNGGHDGEAGARGAVGAAA